MLESMELEEKKVTHDFLSLYAADSSPPEDPKSASQGFYLKTRDFLQPLDGREQGGGRRVEMAAEKAITGGADPSSIGHSGDARVRTGDAQPDTSPVRTAIPTGLEVKPEPDYGSWSTTTSYGSYAGVPYGLWDDKAVVCREQWPSPFIGTAHGNGTGAISATTTATSSQRRLTPEMKGTLEVATSSSSQIHKEIDDDEVFGKRECSSFRTADMTIKVHGRGSNVKEPRPNTPRSKHSATEQRRRTKINDRFQILRQIIPHSDQKRDKASFLIEVIEYVRFLQQKVQSYEAPYSTRNQDAAKLMPWKSSQATANGLSIAPEVIKADPSPHLFSTNCIDGIVPVTVPPSGKQSSATTGTIAGISHKTELVPTCPSNLAFTQNWLQPRLFNVPKENCIAQPQRKLILNQDSTQDQPPLISSSTLTDNLDKERFRIQEQLIIDDGTISISNTYSHGLLNTLAQGLESSGVDLSHAGISVQINLGKRALSRTTAATSSTSTFKGCKRFDYSSLGNNIEQSKAPKRSKLENS